MKKVQRNQTCPCGSGKKYKKCCLQQTPAYVTEAQPDDTLLVATLTDEYTQPMRLYYTVPNSSKLITKLNKLRCIDRDGNDTWLLLYEDEAANMPLNLPPEDVPEFARPLVIASLYLDNTHELLIDVRSVERAIAVIHFLTQHITNQTACITHAAIYNKLITVHKTQHPPPDICFDDLFDEKRMTIIDPEKQLADTETLLEQYGDQELSDQILLDKIQKDIQMPLPEVEKLFVYADDEEGIETLQDACYARQFIAMQHYSGNTNDSFLDVTQKIINELQTQSIL